MEILGILYCVWIQSVLISHIYSLCEIPLHTYSRMRVQEEKNFLALLNCGLKSLLDCKEIQLVLKEIISKWSLEGLMLKLKLQYFGHLMRRTNSLEKTLMLGKIEGRRRRRQQRMRQLDGITDAMRMSLSRHRELVMGREACCAAVHEVAKSQT